MIRRAERDGFAALVLAGQDVRSAILSETRAGLLERGLAVARKNGEIVWLELCLRRLLDIQETPSRIVDLIGALSSQGKLDESNQLLSRLETSMSNSPEAHFVVSGLHAKSGRMEQAFGLIATDLTAHDGPPAPVLATANELLAQCDADQALDYVKMLETHYPEHPAVRGLLLRCYTYVGDTEHADLIARSCEGTLERGSPVARRPMAEAIAEYLAHRGWTIQLDEFCRREIKRDPGHWHLYQHASSAARTLGRSAAYEELLGKLHETPQALAEQARFLVDNHRPDEAMAVIEQLRPESASLYLGTLLYLRLHGDSKQEVASLCQTWADCGLPAIGPAIGMALFAYHHSSSAEELRACIRQLDTYKEQARTNVAFWQIYLRCQVALNEIDVARRNFKQLSKGMQNASKLNPFSMYFEAVSGQHSKAREGWTNHIRQSRHICVNALSSYPITVSLKYREQSDAILLVCCVRNGMAYLDWFLNHYRSLGVDHFFMIDNGSRDGTRQHLVREPDVSVFANDGNFAAAGFGVLWTNHILQRFGAGHWCFQVDIDEAFVFPGQEDDKTLRDLITYCESNGFEALQATEVDMYPAALSNEHAQNSFASSVHFDTDHTRILSELPPYELIHGGIRRRLTGLALSMIKVPLVRLAPDVRYIDCNHSCTHLPFADVTAALLHYKFIGDVKCSIEDAVRSGAHMAGAVSYRKVKSTLDAQGWAQQLSGANTARYDGPESLVKHGIMSSVSRWDTVATATRVRQK